MTNHYHTQPNHYQTQPLPLYESLKVLVESLFIYNEPIYVIGCGSVVGSKCFCARRVLEYSKEEEAGGS